METPQLIGTIHIEYPGASECLRGEQSRATLAIDRRLKSGKLDIVPLSERQLIDLIESAATALRILSIAR